MIIGEEKPSLDDVVEHVGVLGMKWGHRKSATAADINRARLSTTRDAHAYAVARDAAKKHAKGTEARAKADKKAGDLKLKFLNNPDRATAVRMNIGEKAVVTVVLGPAGVAAIAARSAQSRRIQYKQEHNMYTSK